MDARSTGLPQPARVDPNVSRAPDLGPAILLGIGLGGLFDGIVLHQILQWHHMLSEPTPPVTVEALRLNTLADGLFHAFAWVASLIGIAWLAVSWPGRARAGAGRRLAAGLLVGWGLFNVIEGLVDHHLLGLHHVRPGPDALAWDLAFLAWGGLMLAAGAALARRTPRPDTATRAGDAERPATIRRSGA